VVGIGIAAPFELWNWHELVGAPAEEFKQWKSVDFRVEIARFSELTVSVVNDATAACRAEHVFGRGREYSDYAYFFIGTFVGGGVVINHSVHEGGQGNAGAFGALRSLGPDGKDRTLIDTASIFVLEERLSRYGLDPQLLWKDPQDWSGIDDHLDFWVRQVGQEIAKAAASVCAVLDFEAVLIDGAFPAGVRRAIVEQTRLSMKNLDMRGLIQPSIEEGTIGNVARSIGAASGPIFESFFLNRNAGLSMP
jgi:predicted NBD/HSP70 family sugar kinase